MKTSLISGFIIMLWFLPLDLHAQINLKDKKITLDLTTAIQEVHLDIPKGTYNLFLHGELAKITKLSVNKELIEYEPFKIEAVNPEEAIEADLSVFDELVFGDNTLYTIEIQLADEQQFTRKFELKSKSDWTWKTSFGANAIFLTNRNILINRNGVVSEVNDRKMMDVLPSVMFTFMNFHQNLSYGFTAGVGTNFDKVSVMLGPSIGIGQNVIITAGASLHQQDRPSSIYSIGQEIDVNLTSEDLNREYYRVNPFVGVTFNFSKNPFSKE